MAGNGSEFTDHCLRRESSPSGDNLFDGAYAEQCFEHRLIPPRHPQTHGMVECLNAGIAEVLQAHHFGSTEDLETTLHRYANLYNHHIAQKALNHRSPVQNLKKWQSSHPHLFRNKVYQLMGLDKQSPFMEMGRTKSSGPS